MITITNRPLNYTPRALASLSKRSATFSAVRAVSHRRPCPAWCPEPVNLSARADEESAGHTRARGGFSEHDHSQIELCFMMYCSVCRETREGSVRTV